MMWNDTEGVADLDDGTDDQRGDARAALEALLRDAAAMDSLYRTAARVAHVRRDSWQACDLVWDVLGDALLGKPTCDPARPLGPQLEQEVRRRAKRWRRGKRAQRGAPQPVFVALEQAPPSALMLDAPQESREDGQGLDPEELVSRIREQARKDPLVQQLLVLYARGIVLRRDVLKSGMTAWTYRAARERLTAYAATAAYGAGTSATLDPDAAPDAATLAILRPIGATSRPPQIRGAVSRTIGQQDGQA
jgi:hypothetical protein